MTNLHIKNFMVTALLILLGFLVLGGTLMLYGYNYLTTDKQNQLKTVAQNVSNISESYIYGDSLQFDMDLGMVVSAVALVSDAHVIIAGQKGYIVITSDGPLSTYMGQTIPHAIMDSASSTGYFTLMGDLGGVYDSAYFIVGVPVKTQTGVAVGAVFASSPASRLASLFRSFVGIFAIIASLTLLSAYILAYLVSRSMARPLRIMAGAAREFAHGKFGVRVPQSGRDDEMAELASAFNTMADAMEKAEQNRRDFVANISHELKTPMTTISGFIDGILDGTIEPERRDEYLQIIRDEVHRLSRLVMRMLDIAHIQSGTTTFKMQKFDICETLCRTLLNFESKAEAKELDVRVNLADEQCLVQADPDAISQVIYNLIDNAVKFSDVGSPLVLSVYKKGNRAWVSVENAGRPIPPDELPYVFDRFHKADKSRGMDREGMGLGLYIVKMILNGHKQDIWAESNEKMTKFTFTLALSE